MRTMQSGIFALFMLILLSCGKDNKSATEPHNSEEKHWSYSGETSPEHWAEIEKNSDCSGMNQSPINIVELNTTTVEKSKDALEFYYSPKTVLNKVRNNGHSIQFDFEKGDSICSSFGNYGLVQIHFHEPSEHTINGVRYPIEIHLVHQGTLKDYTVISIMGIEGQESEVMEKMESFLPLKSGEEKVIDKSFDLQSIFPEKKDYYTYQGSLTTPPCTENVKWIVFKNPIVVSLEEVLKLRSNMPLQNYRNEQPINDRLVYLVQD